MSLDSEHVCLWKVRYACKLPPMRCGRLLHSLAPILGAMREFQGWENINGSPPSASILEWPAPVLCVDPTLPKNHPAPIRKEGQIIVRCGEYSGMWSPPVANIVDRAKTLFERLMEVVSLMEAERGRGLTRKKVLEQLKNPGLEANAKSLWRSCEEDRQKRRLAPKRLKELNKGPLAIRLKNPGYYLYGVSSLLYDGKEWEVRPELMGLLEKGELSFEELFLPLYLDSFLLKKSDVREYCMANDIEQIRKVPGFILREPLQGKQPEPAPNEEKAQAKSPKRSTGSNKDKERIKKTKEACDQIRKEIVEQGKHSFRVGNSNKTNWQNFEIAVGAILGEIKPHLEAMKKEWKKVPKKLKHGGRPPG